MNPRFPLYMLMGMNADPPIQWLGSIPQGHYPLEKGVVPKEIKHGDERVAHASVVRLEQDRENQHPKQRHGHFDLVIFEPLDSTQSEIAQQQSEEHVVSTQVQSSIMQKAPWNL